MYQLLNKKRNKKGFTLIELIVVIAILAILAAILIPRFAGFTDKARSTQVLVEAKQVATAADGLIAEGKTYITSGTPSAIQFNDGMIKEIAGDDVTGTIGAGSISGDHFIFTYTKNLIVSGVSKPFIATRTSEGAISVTW